MKYDIERLKRKMFVKYPFFGSVVANVSYKEDTTIKTAETDGKTIYYNPNFLNSLNVSEQTFVFAHEEVKEKMNTPGILQLMELSTNF